MKKRMMSLLLALVLLFGILPAESFAAGRERLSAETPTEPAKTMLKWSRNFKEDEWDWANAPSPQTLMGDSLVVMSGSRLFRLDREMGEILAEGAMEGSPSFSGHAPCYGGGMVFCALDGGKVQAFDGETLDSLWVYTNEPGGQGANPILYADGYLYTGFWKGETAEADYVCINAATGEEVWSHTHNGGFYWAQGMILGDYLMVGSDDGRAEGGTLYVFDKKTGEVVASELLVGCGDIRSGIAHADGRLYFTTKGGYLCSVSMDEATGALSDLQTASFGGEATGTPVVYRGKVYFGQGAGWSKGHFMIADGKTLAVEEEIALPAPVQASPLLSTAYEETTGRLYFYITCNSNPGGIYQIATDTDGGNPELTALFTPPTAQQNYCNCSVIADGDGNLYYKNDSGTVFCVGKTEAAGDITVAVTLADQGRVILAEERITVSDRNEDGIIDMDEALFAAHEAAYEGGAAAGYAAENGSITKLWGKTDESYGYGRNDDRTLGLDAPLREGDRVTAFVRTSPTDSYAAFDRPSYTLTVGAAADVTLLREGAPDSAGTLKLYDRTLTEVSPDAYRVTAKENGGYTLSVAKAGTYFLIATGEGMVPAVAQVAVKSPSTQEDTMRISFTVRTHAETWISLSRMKLPEDSTVQDALEQAEKETDGFSWEGSGGYVSAMTYQGERLEEFDEGPNSGWKYKVNGGAPTVGMDDFTLEDGDRVVWYYTTDYTADDTPNVDKNGNQIETEEAGSPLLTPAGKADSKGEAEVAVEKDDLLSAMKAAEKEDEAAIVIAPYIKGDAEKVSVTLPLSALKKIAEESGLGLTIRTDAAALTLSGEGLAALTRQAQERKLTFVLEKTKADDVGALAKQELPADAVAATVAVFSGEETITEWGGKEALTLSIPVGETGYRAGESYDVILVREDGRLELLQGVCLAEENALAVEVLVEALGTFLVLPTPLKPTETPLPFADAAGHWAAEGIAYVHANGIFSGMTETTFAPDAPMTRAMLVSVLYRMAGSPDAAGDSAFSDIKDGDWCEAAVNWAAAQGIVSGYENGAFGAEDAVSRQQLAVILQRYGAYQGYDTGARADLSAFADGERIEAYARPAMEWAAAEGLLRGTTETTLSPDGKGTRAQVATLLMHFMEAFAEK